jgi:hypothetical protein
MLIEATIELEGSMPKQTSFEARETAKGWTLKAA